MTKMNEKSHWERNSNKPPRKQNNNNNKTDGKIRKAKKISGQSRRSNRTKKMGGSHQ